MASEQVEFDRQGLNPGMPHELFIFFMPRLLKLKSKLKTEHFTLDFQNMESSYNAFYAAYIAEQEFLASEKNVYLDTAFDKFMLIYHKGSGCDSDTASTLKTAAKVVDICTPYTKGPKKPDRGKLKQRHSTLSIIKDKIKALGAAAIKSIDATKAVSELEAALTSYNDTASDRNDFFNDLKGKTTSTKAEAVADLRAFFNSIPSVQHKTGYKENAFVKALNKLITETKERGGKSDSDSSDSESKE